ncbi:hypothetical protein ABB37_08592 [Leptomonas pyrrhocoris]|uniref:Uncharacterized protein n=1 Tax=Leptomonas pyrrhocoris TaxID=157538 RepID=A0A0N0DS10_LEPPY|nr:hypothetical protein ABB37_08592 [Leptomonas pyrrhocoris]KPA75291.1 hypothetical protein ABB37_08592 [Leptomonas pyrrhocoris]|eukprot:XP_015653730.1 hypothetical protein ABB37_08592 [Leptomonas pyrrhocoris]
MRSLRLGAVYGGNSLLQRPVSSAVSPSPAIIPECRFVASPAPSAPGAFTRAKPTTVALAITWGRRWYATAAAKPASTPAAATPAATTFSRLSTAAEAAAELQRWVGSVSDIGTATTTSDGTPPLVLSGKSLVLCVTALQLREAEHTIQLRSSRTINGSSNSDAKSGSGAAAPPSLVQQYLTALARHVYVHCNAGGKPHAAWQIFADVEKNALCADVLYTALHFLQHHAFDGAPQPASARHSEGEQQTPADYDAKCAARDLEVTFEAVEVLLAGWQIAEVHRVAAAAAAVGSPSTTAAMVPAAEAAAFYIGAVVHLAHAPLGCGATPPAATTTTTGTATTRPSPFLTLPPAKQQYWQQAAQQLTTVLYLALLVTNTSTTDALLVNQAFRGAVRAAYDVPTTRFGVVRSMHYMVTVAVPYVARSMSTILDVVRAQQTEAARAAAAAVKATQQQRTLADTSKRAMPTFAQKGRGGEGQREAAAGGGGTGRSSDRMNKLTLVIVCVAAVVYMASSNTELLWWSAGDTSPSADKEEQQASELHQTYQKLSAMATSATAPQIVPGEEPESLVNALQRK